MATLTHATTEHAWDTRLTNLATGFSAVSVAASLTAATRHDFTAINVYVPESGVTFLSAQVEITVRSAWSGSARNISGWRIGMKLGAVAFDDVDYTPSTINNNGAEGCFRFTRDVTAYFVTNWSGTSMAAQVGVAFATAVAADNVNNIAAKLLLTYSYSDSSATRIKTVRIPIQSHHTTLTTSQQEIGTAGGVNDAPANQIPALDTYLKEASKAYRNVFLEFFGTDGRASSTDFNASVQVDSVTAFTRATLEAQTPGSIWYHDIIPYDTGTFATNSTHSLKALGSTTARFTCLGAVLVVTYEYDEATTTQVTNHRYYPIDSRALPYNVNGTATADADRYQFEVWVEEPGTITLVQSALLLWNLVSTSGPTAIKVWAGGQAERTYTWPNLEHGGQQWFVHRCDHGTSPWTLARGRNLLPFGIYASTAETCGLYGGFALINFTSDKASDSGKHGISCCWSMFDYPTSGTITGQRAVASPKVPTLGTRYWLDSLGIEALHLQTPTANGTPVPNSLMLELQVGESNGDGWMPLEKVGYAPNFYDIGNYDTTYDITSQVNRTDQATGKLSATAARAVRVRTGSAYTAARWWATFHQLTFSVAGTVAHHNGTSSGITVNAHTNLDGSIVSTTTTASGGGYTLTVYDSANTHYPESQQDSTHCGRGANVTPT